MSQKSSLPQLRLVKVDDQPTLEQASPVADWQALCDSFSSATGLPLEFHSGAERPTNKNPLWTAEVPAVGPFAPGMFSLTKRAGSRVANERATAACDLAEQVGSLVRDLQNAQQALAEREAELATAIPLIVRRDEEPHQLAKRFAAILQGGAEAVGCQAAASFLLDDSTQVLKLRSHFGLSNERLTDSPRLLKESQADIFALAGQAVVISEISEREHWGVPDEFASAVCVPISTATMPLGTLWMYCAEEREFSEDEVNIIEIIAGRMATEFEREILLREQGVLGTSAHVTEAIEWQQSQLPRTVPVVDDWEIAARPSSRSRLHGDFYHWHRCEDEVISLTVATSYDQGVPAALTAATISGIVRQQADKSPVARLEQVNQALWQGSDGDRHAAMFSGSMHSQTGRLEFVALGQVDAFIIRPHSWEAITIPTQDPVGLNEALLTNEFDVIDPAKLRSGELQSGDSLLVLTGRPRRRPKISTENMIDAAHYAEAALVHAHLPTDELTTLLASLWESQSSPWEMPPAMLITRYR